MHERWNPILKRDLIDTLDLALGTLSCEARGPRVQLYRNVPSQTYAHKLLRPGHQNQNTFAFCAGGVGMGWRVARGRLAGPRTKTMKQSHTHTSVPKLTPSDAAVSPYNDSL
ncbi:hypothetical protein C0Q70_09485 [Pomacea canaliculata]|uniref:Uncharacterized protein n=1 Tax=Pomacea canaliculata TaxID=400727 RepID=A0A2T7P9Y3_POMCA|nr:hypothetical protein C0Q70_09485 [Pomacea canaliculata]